MSKNNVAFAFASVGASQERGRFVTAVAVSSRDIAAAFVLKGLYVGGTE